MARTPRRRTPRPRRRSSERVWRLLAQLATSRRSMGGGGGTPREQGAGRANPTQGGCCAWRAPTRGRPVRAGNQDEAPSSCSSFGHMYSRCVCSSLIFVSESSNEMIVSALKSEWVVNQLACVPIACTNKSSQTRIVEELRLKFCNSVKSPGRLSGWSHFSGMYPFDCNQSPPFRLFD